MFVPAAAWYFPIYLCAVFPRVARKHRTPLNMEYRSAEGWQGQLRKSYIIRGTCLIGYCDTTYFAASFLTVVTFRIVEGTPTVFANRVPVNSGESLSRMRQSQ